jgi:hypothetical protein
MITDKTGRKLKVGQMVDIPVFAVLTGKVMVIKEHAIALSANQVIPPHVVIALNLTPGIHPNGMVSEIYVTQDADPKDPLVIEAEGSNLRIIRPS